MSPRDLMFALVLALVVLFFDPVIFHGHAARAENHPPSDLQIAIVSATKPSTSDVDYTTDPFADAHPSRHAPLADPLIKLNRVLFKINGAAYLYILNPAAKAWQAVVPRPVRTGVSNFFHNLTEPLRFTSSMLQGRPKDGGRSIGRLLINSTVGIGGFFNVAPHALEDVDRDFDQTLARWGVGPGIYLMLPFKGPSSVRDAVTSVGESFLDPVNYISGPHARAKIFGANSVNTVNNFSFRINDVGAMMNSTLDPYAAVKAYYEDHLPIEGQATRYTEKIASASETESAPQEASEPQASRPSEANVFTTYEATSFEYEGPPESAWLAAATTDVLNAQWQKEGRYAALGSAPEHMRVSGFVRIKAGKIQFFATIGRDEDVRNVVISESDIDNPFTGWQELARQITIEP